MHRPFFFNQVPKVVKQLHQFGEKFKGTFLERAFVGHICVT
jgi:hypothetical protein